MRTYLILLLSILAGQLSAQTDFYDRLKTDYDRLRKEEKHDSALAIAKQMNAWALKNETDTSLKYAVSLRYVGNCFYRFQMTDSAILYWNKSLTSLEKQNRLLSDDAASCLNNFGLCYTDMGDFESAEPYYLRVMAIRKEALGVENQDYASSLNSLGNLYSDMGNYRAAELYYRQASEIIGKVLGKKHSNYAMSLNNLGLLYSEMGNYISAESYLLKALDVYKKNLEVEHPDCASNFNNLGILYSEIGNYEAAETYYLQALTIRKKVLGEYHSDYASSLNNLGILYVEIGNYQAAEPFFLEVSQVRKKTIGENHQDYASSLLNLGNLYTDMGNFKTAEPYYLQALEIYKRCLGESHPKYASILNSLGILYSDMGNNQAAEPYYLQAMAIRERVLGEEHPDYASSLNNLGILYAEIGNYTTAEAYYLKGLTIFKNAFGEEHPQYASSLSNLGILYSNMGNYLFAERYYIRALVIRQKVLGEEHPDCASSSNNLGSLYSDMGNYQAAEQYLLRAMTIYKKSLGDEHPEYASSLNNLGVLYAEMGNYPAAESYYLQALAIREKVFGEYHPDYASSLYSLGSLYYDMGNYQAAESHYLKALVIREKVLGKEHLDCASSLNSLGNLYMDMNNYQSAEHYLLLAMSIYKESLGEEHVDYAMTLNNLGILHKQKGNYLSAETYYLQAMAIKRKVLGDNHPDYTVSLINLGYLYEDMGNYPAAEANYRIGFEKGIFQLNLNFSWLSSKEKEAFWQDNNGFYFDLNSFSAKAADEFPLATMLSSNGSLISKSLLLETSRELDQAISQSGDSTLLSQYTEMKQLRRTFNKMQSEGSDKREIMDRYNLQADSLDKILVNKLGEYAASKRKFEITWKDVQSNLSSSEAAIEFARYYDDKDSSYKYLALVVRPSYAYPELVKLGKEEDIRAANQSKAHDFAALYDYVWKDIDSLLVGVNTVYYSPAGELNNVSFSALCFGTGDSLIASTHNSKRGVEIELESAAKRSCNGVLLDKYVLHQLTTTRYLADGTLKKNRELNSSITLMGGVNYDDVPAADKNAVHEEAEEDYALNLNLTNQVQDKRGNRSSSGVGKPMKYLEGTREEVTHIAAQLNGSWSVQSLSDRKASEHSLKSQLETKSPGVLHIATHGFAFPDVKQEESSQLMIDEKPAYKISEDPMVRCGLMLSGSNISWTGNPKKMIEQTGEDGILTAAEVSSMNLSNTKLVVLSACETGLGKIEGSEGTFGLKRGFKLAGVEQMIVSLWSVPDKETMELMTLFYTDLTKTLNPVISFEKAQKEMRTKYPTEPEKWAGFVLVR
jgi:tetratricopeptide (TPR) repeat protein